MLRRAIKSKRPGILLGGIILLHDNARPHTAILVRDKLKRFGWEILQHPPYSPNLSPCDFGDLKKDFRGCLFHLDEEVGEIVDPSATYLFYKPGIDRLVSQLDKCINTSGNYF